MSDATSTRAVEDFAERLRALFTAAGSPTLAAACAGAARIAPGGTRVTVQRLSDWRRGRHLPAGFDTLDPVLTWLILQAQLRPSAPAVPPLPQWRAWWQHARDHSPTADEPVSEPSPAAVVPYAGLTPLTAADRAMFFGRDDVIAELGTLIESTVAAPGGRMVVVTGVSGAGKSSLLGAGLAVLAAGRRGRWCVRRSLAVELIEEAHGADSSAEQSSREQGSAEDSSAECESFGADAAVAANTELTIWAVDQVEGALVGASEDQTEILVDRLTELADQRNTVVVLGVRADMFERCAGIAPIAAAWQHRSLIVPPMTDAQLADVIVRPARAAGLRVDKALAATMIADLDAAATPRGQKATLSRVGTNRAGQLPLLAQVLSVMWAQRRGGALTVAGYRAAGGVATAIADTAERVWTGLSPRARQVARSLLLSTVRIDEHTVIRRHADGTRLAATGADPEVVSEVVESFAQARLVTIASGHLEFVHDVVLAAWPRMVAEIDRVRATAPLLQRVTDDAREWQDAGRPPSLLYSADHYHRASVIADDPLLSDVVAEFLTAGEAALNRRAHQRRAGIAAVVVLAVVSVIAAVTAIAANVALSGQRDDARYSALIQTASRLTETDPGAAAQLAVAALRLRPDDGRAQLRVLQTQQLPLPSSATAAGRGHIGAVYDLAVGESAAGTLVATAGNDGTVRLWNAADAEHIIEYPTSLTVQHGFVTSVALAARTRQLAAAAADGTITVYDVSDPVKPARRGVLRAPKSAGASYIARYSADGKLLATTSDSGAVTLWDTTTGDTTAGDTTAGDATPGDTQDRGPDGSPYRVLATVADHVRPVRSLAFSPTAPLLAVASDDATMSIVNIADPTAPTTVATIADGGESGWHSVAVSSSGLLAAGRDDGGVAVYDLAESARPRLVAAQTGAHLGAVWSVGFDAAGTTVVSASLDGTAQRWDVAGITHRRAPARLDRIGEPIRTGAGAINTTAYLTPATVLTGGAAGQLQSWSMPTSPLPAHTLPITRPAVSPDGRLLATGSADQTIDLWDVTDPLRPARRSTIERPIGTSGGFFAAFNRTGRILAVAFGGGRHVELFDVGDATRPQPLADLELGTRYTYPLAFAPDRDVLITGDTDTSLARWNVADPRRPVRIGAPLTGPSAFVERAVFSPDGTRLSVASADHRIYRWSMRAGDPVSLPAVADHSGVVNDLAYSRVGDYLYSASDDQTIGVTSETGSRAARIPVGSRVASLSVSTDGRTLAVGTDQSIEIWDLSDPAAPRRRGDGVSLSLLPVMSRYVTAVGDRAVYTGGQPMLQWWDTDVAAVAARVCSATNGSLTPQRWEQIVDDVSYVRPCG